MKEREKMIHEKIKEEDFLEMVQLRGVKQVVWTILTEAKGFDPEEIEIEPKFELALSDCEGTVGIDFVINLPAGTFAVIRCANSGLEFWERYVTAFGRAVKDYQIPFAMVTNGDDAKIISVLSGALVGEKMTDFYTRQEAMNIMKDFKKVPCPEKTLEKAKRIIYAFEGIKCPAPPEDK
jgi:hypothetical protein